MSDVQPIDLERLQEGVCSYSRKKCQYAFEAAIVCLKNMGHESGVLCRLDGWRSPSGVVSLHWNTEIDESLFASWDDLNEMVENGATGIALALIDRFTDFDLVRRAERGRGVDFYIGYKRDVRKLKGFRVFAARLEVSGILAAKDSKEVERRVEQKKTQTKDSDSDMNPAHVIVAEFSAPMVDWSVRNSQNGP